MQDNRPLKTRDLSGGAVYFRGFDYRGNTGKNDFTTVYTPLIPFYLPYFRDFATSVLTLISTF